MLLELGEKNVPAAIDLFVQAQEYWNSDAAEEGDKWDRLTFWRGLFRAEVHVATAQLSKALNLHDELLSLASAGNRVRWKVYVLAKHAEALAIAGKRDEALVEAERVIKLATRTKIVRPLLDAGSRFEQLLRIVHGRTEELDLRTFIESTFSQFAPASAQKGPSPPSAMPEIVEELTHRELEVLRLLTMGSKNKDICAALGLSENTVKWYLKRIFEKLSVNNRTEAALIAKSIMATI